LGLSLLFPCLSQAVRVGDQAPDFALLDLDGVPHSLAEMPGKVVVLYFLGHNAAACREPALALQTSLARFENRGVRILGIECWNGSAEQTRQFRSQSGVSFPILLAGQAVAQTYDLAYNSYVVVDGKGFVRYVHAGPDATAFSLSELERVVEASIEDAAAVTNATWGVIKALYDPRRRERMPV